VATLASVLEGREEVNCPICKHPLLVSPQPDGKYRFDGCNRKCLPMYWVPEDSIVLGPVGGVMTIYRRKWNPNEPEPTLVPKYTNGGW
jgi:hypothetical protein